MLFNIALGAASFLGGWVLNNMTKAIDRLDHDVREMPITYVSKEDFREANREMREEVRLGFDRMETNINNVFKKLDRKEDKN